MATASDPARSSRLARLPGAALALALALTGCVRDLGDVCPGGARPDRVPLLPVDAPPGQFACLAATPRGPRSNAAVVRLADGRVLVAGGQLNLESPLDTAELFVPGADGGFSPTGPLNVPRWGATATLLASGKVLLVGGTAAGAPLASAELFDPAAAAGRGAFTRLPDLSTARPSPTATLLADGRVLVAGETDAELFDPTANGGAGAFSPVGALLAPRGGAADVRLPDGRVLLLGRTSEGRLSAEYFDPAQAGADAGADGGSSRAFSPARLVLALDGGGGWDPDAGAPVAGTWVGASLDPPLTATLLLDGRVLVTARGSVTDAALLLELDGGGNGLGTLAGVGRTPGVHTSSASAVRLADGRVLLTSGISSPEPAQLFDPRALEGRGVLSQLAGSALVTADPPGVLLLDGTVLFVGGQPLCSYLPVTHGVWVFDPAHARRGSFAATGNLSTPRLAATATLLEDGRVLIAGGRCDPPSIRRLPTPAPARAELFDPAANGGRGAFAPGASLESARVGATATLLPGGRVLIAGGYNRQGVLASAELFDPAAAGGAGAFTPTGSLGTARAGATATLLPSGKVLIAGGSSVDFLAAAELYDPLTGAFSPTGSLGAARGGAAALLLPSGKVLIAGGYNAADSLLTSAELFDPSGNGGAGAFSPTGSLGAPRFGAALVPLASGQALVVGGEGRPFSRWTYPGDALLTAERFDPAGNGGAGAFERLPWGLSGRLTGPTVTPLADGGALVVGGDAQVFEVATGRFTLTRGGMAPLRAYATATLLPDGRVLVAGGTEAYSGDATDSADLFQLP